jgi:hypothetical protein
MIQTRDGARTFPVAWQGFLAVDPDGYPVVIDATAKALGQAS